VSEQRNITTIALVVALVAVPGLLCLGLVAVGAAVGMMRVGAASEPGPVRQTQTLPVDEEVPEWLEEEIPPAADPRAGGPDGELEDRSLRGTTRSEEGSVGLGNLGTIGTPDEDEDEGSGYGRGAGGLRGDSARVPRVRNGNADVRGSLSREVIQRVIRRHINEVRFCYEQQLSRNPTLEGRVDVSFIISPTGSVQSAMVRNTTLNDARVESCVTQAVRRWHFPAPDGGGIVAVNYPFVFSSAD